MASISRIRTALDDGLLQLVGQTAVLIRPDMSFDVSVFEAFETSVVETFFPNHKAWAAAGYNTLTSTVDADVTVVTVPRSKELARALVADAAQRSKLVIVDGSKINGIESIYKSCRKQLGDLPSVSKGHGRVFWFNGADQFADWKITEPTLGPDGFYTTAGVFSDGKIDQGSKALAAVLPTTLPPRIADLGAGWGYLAQAILQRTGVATVDLVEAEALSLECARQNVADNRAQFIWEDATQFGPDAAYGAVVMNPPFHTGRDGDPGLGQAFIRSAARILVPNGTLWMVANRHLPYENTLSDCFRQVEQLPSPGGFKLIKASRPKG